MEVFPAELTKHKRITEIETISETYMGAASGHKGKGSKDQDRSVVLILQNKVSWETRLHHDTFNGNSAESKHT